MSTLVNLADAQRAYQLATDDDVRAAAAARIRLAMAEAGHTRALVIDSVAPSGDRVIHVAWGVDGSKFT